MNKFQIIILVAFSTLVASCGQAKKPTLSAAIESCLSGVISQKSYSDRAADLEAKGFQKTDVANAPQDLQNVFSMLRNKNWAGLPLEESSAIGGLFTGDDRNPLFVLMFNLDTTGSTSLKGHGDICIISDKKVAKGSLSTTVANYILSHKLVSGDTSEKLKARPDDIHMLRFTTVNSSNALDSNGFLISISDGSFGIFNSALIHTGQ